MDFIPYGPFELPRDDGGLLLLDRSGRKSIWDSVDHADPGLADACGCYVFAIRNGGGILPWYVGKAERQSFKLESLTEHKTTKYNEALLACGKGTPLLYLYARVTRERHNFSKPTRSEYRDVSYLEKMLIGLALRRNPNVLNARETELLRTMCVPGLLNTKPGGVRQATLELASVLGY